MYLWREIKIKAMANAFWGAARKMEHPNYDYKTGKFVCAGCGEYFDTAKPHSKHIFENHSKEFAYDNMPAKWYNEFYQTDEWKLKKARQKVINDHKKLIRKAGIEIRYSKSLGWFNFYDKESGRYMSHDDVSERVPEFNLDILHGRLHVVGIDIKK